MLSFSPQVGRFRTGPSAPDHLGLALSTEVSNTPYLTFNQVPFPPLVCLPGLFLPSGFSIYPCGLSGLSLTDQWWNTYFVPVFSKETDEDRGICFSNAQDTQRFSAPLTHTHFLGVHTGLQVTHGADKQRLIYYFPKPGCDGSAAFSPGFHWDKGPPYGHLVTFAWLA